MNLENTPKDQNDCGANRITAIRAIVKAHTDKLNIMKDKLSRWEEEKWTDAEIRECNNLIKTLAEILSDLNRALI